MLKGENAYAFRLKKSLNREKFEGIDSLREFLRKRFEKKERRKGRYASCIGDRYLIMGKETVLFSPISCRYV